MEIRDTNKDTSRGINNRSRITSKTINNQINQSTAVIVVLRMPDQLISAIVVVRNCRRSDLDNQLLENIYSRSVECDKKLKI